MKTALLGILFFIVTGNPGVIAQDTRVQFGPGLKNSYFGVNIGAISYPFTAAQMEPGFSVESVIIPPTAVRIILFGHQFNKYLSAQISYMRPVSWVLYKNINGAETSNSVWMNVGGLTLLGHLPLGKKFSLSGEAGFGLITRKGFSFDNERVIRDANYGTVLTGGALQYHLDNKWDLQLSTVWSPARKNEKQPRTLFIGAGFNYHMRPLPKEITERNAKSGYLFPKDFLIAGITSNLLGYGVNDAVSKGPVPIFWGGEVHIKRGFALHYQRTLFRTRKIFSLDWGAGVAAWKSRDKKQDFFTASLYPVLHFNAIRRKNFDLFFEYAVAGPTFISRKVIDDKQTGKNFTFYDFMGMGFLLGKERNINAGLRIAHFSNGNIFPNNDGLKIPLTLNIGYTISK